MKNILRIAMITSFGVIALTSCKKNWKCACSVDVMGFGLALPDSLSPTVSNMTKKNAQQACNDNASYINGLLTNIIPSGGGNTDSTNANNPLGGLDLGNLKIKCNAEPKN